MRYSCVGPNEQYLRYECESCGNTRKLLSTLVARPPPCPSCDGQMEQATR